jgi:hypothetical protein
MHCPAIERLHEEFKRRIKVQTVLPSADTAACITSGDIPLNRLFANEPQRTSSVVLGWTLITRLKGTLFRSVKIRSPKVD